MRLALWAINLEQVGVTNHKDEYSATYFFVKSCKRFVWMMNENKMPHEAGKSNEPGKMPPPPHDGKGPYDGKMPLPHADQQAPNGQQPQGPQM